MSALETAQALASRGIRVHPTRNKAPMLPTPLESATTDAQTIADWWQAHPQARPGLYPGQSGLVVVDVDEKNGVSGHESLIEAGHDLPKTWNYATPSGGRHYVYAVPDGITLTTADAFLAGVDLRGGNGNVVCYAKKGTAAIAPAPDWLLLGAAPGERRASANRRTLAGVDDYLDRLVPGKPSKKVRKALAAFDSRDMSHADLLAGVAALVRLGQDGAPGVDAALTKARATYADGWGGEYLTAFEKALQGSVSRFGLPLPSFALSKAEKRAHAARHAEPATLPLSEGAAVLDEVRAQIRRFVALPTEWHEAAVALWAAHTHLIDRFDSTPRLYVNSPEPGSGKTRVLETLARLVLDPVETMNTSVAFLARRIDSGDLPPTILHDEVDTLFGVRSRDATAEELRGIYNSGHRRGAKYNRAATRGKEVILEEFSTFAPVAMAGLGELPDTIRTRSVVIPMRRRRADETVEPYRERQNGRELEATRDRVAAWARTAAKSIGAPWPEMPEGIADRDADVWEPLLAVADAAGGEWPRLARDAALVILRDAHDRPASLGIRLLADVRRVFDKGGDVRLRSTELLHELVGLEEAPWADLGGKGAIDSRFLGRTFDGYGIPPAHPIRFGGSIGVAKGWDRRDFADAWGRYLPDFAPEAATFPTDQTTNKEKKQ